MDQLKILTNVDRDQLYHWLNCICLPFVVEPEFFVEMGFSRCFVLQHSRKHKNVRQLDGQVRHGVLGVSEADFLIGLAEALGSDISQANRALSNAYRMKLAAEACIKVLDGISANRCDAGRRGEDIPAQDCKCVVA